VETAANGSGIVVPAQSVNSGNSITVYAISRDAGNNFVANVSGTWSLIGNTGGVVSADLTGSGTSATFTGHVIGTVAIHIVSGSLTSTDSGTITVTAGTATQVRVETAADGSGTVVGSQSLTAGNTLTVYAITRDASNNFVANAAATWSFSSTSNGVTGTDLVANSGNKSATMTGHLVGTGVIHAAVSGLTSTDSGTITVTAGTATKVRVETAADGSGVVVPAQSVNSGNSITVYAISRDAGNNFIANVSGTWSLASITGGVVSGDLTGSGTSATFAGHVIGTTTIHVVSGGLTSTDSGTITVTAGTATQVRVETAANGSGVVVPAQSVNSGNSITIYAISRDASNNFVANVSGTWSLTSITGGVVSGDLTGSGTSATFTGHIIGTATIHIVSGSLTNTDSGTITVTVGSAAKLVFTTQPGGGTGGTAWTTQPVVTVEDAGGNTVTTDTSTVTVAIANNAGPGGVLSGTLTKAAVAGVANFSSNGLKIDKIGMGYTLTATDGTLTNATSSAFNITVGSASKLAFIQQPSDSATGASITPALTVAIQDAGGNTVTTSNASITVAIGNNPQSGTLSGTNPVSATSGVATFSNLSINKAGTGYTLTATSGTLTSATSSSFNIIGTFGVTTTGSTNYPTTNIGNTTGSYSNPNSINYLVADKYVTTVPLTAITIYTWGTGGGNVKVSIYSDSSGSPGTELFTEVASAVSQSAWTAITIPTSAHPGQYLAPGTYWIVFNCDTANGVTKPTNSPASNPARKLQSLPYSSSFSSASGSWATGAGVDSTYIVGVPVEGYVKATKATFSYINNANITSVSFYAQATGNVRLAIYSNSGSAPLSLQWQSGDITISATGWNTVSISSGTPTSLTLPGGTYWLAWQWNSVNSGPSYTAGSSGTGYYIQQAYGSFVTWSGGTSSSENWSIYASYH